MVTRAAAVHLKVSKRLFCKKELLFHPLKQPQATIPLKTKTK